jgi:DNA-binding protein HU-beta
MNKAELIESIAKSADVSKAAATRALDGAIKAISVALKKGDVVTLVGFGSFYVGKRTARTGRNPAQALPSRSRQPRFRSSALAKL